MDQLFYLHLCSVLHFVNKGWDQRSSDGTQVMHKLDDKQHLSWMH